MGYYGPGNALKPHSDMLSTSANPKDGLRIGAMPQAWPASAHP